MFFRWRGNYGGNVQNWFPANHVEEIVSAEEDSDASPLGTLQKGTIDLTGITVGTHRLLYFFVVTLPTT